MADIEWVRIPSTKLQRNVRSQLGGLSKRKISYPRLQIAGLTESEKEAQGILSDYLTSGTPTAITQAKDYYSGVLGGGYDPRTSPYYQGYREQSQFEEDEAMNTLRRRMQLSGVGASTPAIEQEIAGRGQFAANRQQLLGQLYEAERAKQQGAAQNLAQLGQYEEAQPIRKMAATQEYGALPRTIEQARANALYEKLVQELLFPYIYKAPIKQFLLQEPRYSPYIPAPTDSGSSAFGGILGGLF